VAEVGVVVLEVVVVTVAAPGKITLASDNGALIINPGIAIYPCDRSA